MGQSGVLLDLLVLVAVYAAWLLPKWRRLGKRPLLVYTLMYGCLAGIVRFTLMPVLTALPYCFDHPYIPMHMAPFEDVIHRHGDYVRQIVLNVVLFLPFGVLQPLLHVFRRADITDVITNTIGGVLGYALWALGNVCCKKRQG